MVLLRATSCRRITGQGKTRGISAALDTEATINQHVAYVTPRNDVIGAEYLQLALSAAYRELRAISDDSGSTKGALTCWDISHFRVPLPPRAEQAEITLATRQATKTLESTSAKAAQEVMLAREYRARLIADIVTGKLDVRAAAAGLPEVDPLAAEDDSDDGSNPEAPLSHGDEVGVTGQVGLIQFRRRFSYAADVLILRSNSAGLIWPSVECRRRWL